MDDMVDQDGRELTVGARIALARDIEMERLFAGYDAALNGAPTPRDLTTGCEGTVQGFETALEPVLIVEFCHAGAPFWRGALRGDEVRWVAG